MRIAIAKPDLGISGGFELVMSQIARHLTAVGHDLHWLNVDIPAAYRRYLPKLTGNLRNWEQAKEYFEYVALVRACETIEAKRADLLISSQPPSFGVFHDRHLNIFFHHARFFYDLADVATQAGFVKPEYHALACKLVRGIDQPLLDSVTFFLAGSVEVQQRLLGFNGITKNVGLFQAGLGFQNALPSENGLHEFEYPICVSRQEFTKRTELFVAAMKHFPRRTGIVVGSGGRLGYVQRLDARLSRPDQYPNQDPPEAMWLCNPEYEPPLTVPTEGSNVVFTGHATNDELENHYRRALCVVAPALREDYGLTAIEGMAYGKPIIVCRDGGNLTRIVQDGENGLVVDPRPEAIAEAIDLLANDPAMARSLGEQARLTAANYTWKRALDQVDQAIEQVVG